MGLKQPINTSGTEHCPNEGSLIIISMTMYILTWTVKNYLKFVLVPSVNEHLLKPLTPLDLVREIGGPCLVIIFIC